MIIEKTTQEIKEIISNYSIYVKYQLHKVDNIYFFNL